MKRKTLDRIGLLFVATVMISPVVLFFLWMISLSLKYEIDNGAYPPIFIPERLAWSNYLKVFEENNFFLYLWNSVLVTGAATLLALLIGVPAGYGIARLKAEKSAMVIMIARMTPGLSFLIPLFLLFQWLNLLGTLMPQIIIHLVVTVPIVVWIMIGYFETTPMELEEAASIDGATPRQVFRWSPCRSQGRASSSPSSCRSSSRGTTSSSASCLPAARRARFLSRSTTCSRSNRSVGVRWRRRR